MAYEIRFPYQSGYVVKAIVIRPSDNFYWKVATNSWVVLNTATWSTYQTALTESGTNVGDYVGTWPVSITTAGLYRLLFIECTAGVTIAQTTTIGSGEIYWSGSAEVLLASAVNLELVHIDTDSLLARLGAWTGSGINTVLGALRAIAAKAASLTPTDLSTATTYDNTTDSVEAIRDRGDAAWISGGGGIDPLLNAVPGAYAAGTAGYVLGSITPPAIITIPSAVNGARITLVRGDSYKNVDGRALVFGPTSAWSVLSSGAGLTGGAVSFAVKDKSGTVVIGPIAGSVVSATSCRVDLTSANTTIAAGGQYIWDVQVTLANTDKVTIAAGPLTVLLDCAA